MVRLLHRCSGIVVKHVYREANSGADWMASFVANHSEKIFWSSLEKVPISLRDTLLIDPLRYIRFHTVT